jgi:hypothetical protein
LHVYWVFFYVLSKLPHPSLYTRKIINTNPILNVF